MINKEDIIEISNTDVKKCMKCGKCSARCPSFAEMDVKPHQFVSYVAEGKIDKLLASKSVWNCLSCMACVERCPRGVAPASVIEAIRDVIVRQPGANGIKAEELSPMIDENVPQQLLVAGYRKYNK